MKNSGKRQITKKDLEDCDGKEGRPAYVAFKGKVFDVSNSELWANGSHMNRHKAGNNLAPNMPYAPHGGELLKKFPVVGELVEAESYRLKGIGMVERLHLHPIMVHFTIAYSVIVPFLAFLYFVTSQIFFETASYYMLAFGLLSTPFSALSGLFDWKATYKGRMSKIFFRKIIFAILLLIVLIASFIARTLNADIILPRTISSGIYLTLLVSLVPINFVLGYYGGKIVYS